jgi:uncharacterized membrane protein YkoI
MTQMRPIKISRRLRQHRNRLSFSRTKGTNMKLIALVSSIIVALGVVGCASTDYSNNPEAHEKLHAQAKIDRAEAERVALQRVPGGTVKDAELEKEHGKLVWSFEFTTPGSSDITEVHVDAITGAVLRVSKEASK